MLEGAHNPHTGDLLARHARQLMVAQLNRSAGRLIKTGQAVEHRGFSGAVRPD